FTSNDKPLLTFAVASFNQESYVRNAIESAFAQKYSPLEIILSDDCSKDKTFAIMRQMAQTYKGSHRIILNQNERNLGLVGHLNRLVELAAGDLIVCAGGDDISFPERASLSVQAWEVSDRRATSIHGRWIGIDEHGRHTGLEKTVLWPKYDSLI